MSTPEKPALSLLKMIRAFEKIGRGIAPFPLGELEKELLKMQPSEESEVSFFADYDEEDHSLGLSIYVSLPLAEEKPEKCSFGMMMHDYLLRADLKNLPAVWNCLQMTEQKEGETYEIDFIPVFFNEELGDFYFRCRFTKA